MQKIMFNERYGLQKAVFDGRKTQTRREPFYSYEEIGCVMNKNGKLECYIDFNGNPIHTSRYAVGEVVAIAERYNDLMQDGSISSFDKGWKNKMFVQADLMPHHIKITDIRCERLQDITDDDCMKEGIFRWGDPFHEDREEDFGYVGATKHYLSPKSAFAALIGKLNGKKFWGSNPYVIVYEFKKND